jgi:hypothetical protein
LEDYGSAREGNTGKPARQGLKFNAEFAMSRTEKTAGRSGSLRKGIKPKAQPRFIAGGRVAMEDALLNHTVQHRKSRDQQAFGARPILGVKRLAKLADLVPHPCAVSPVPFGSLARLCKTLESGLMICHRFSFAKAMNKIL